MIKTLGIVKCSIIKFHLSHPSEEHVFIFMFYFKFTSTNHLINVKYIQTFNPKTPRDKKSSETQPSMGYSI
jgi:hypothetical protein